MFSYDFCEAASDTDLSPSVEDIQALNQMDSSVRKVDDHYELPLPWRTGCPSLPNNRQVAEKRLNCLRKRFNEEPDLFQQYKDRMNGYEDQGYTRKVPEDAYSDKVWYIPHHATTQSKFRIVFDCAAKFKNSSLTEQLLKGPDHTNNLVGVLLRFRQELFAFACDITSMFHQVKVTPRDCDYLRFLWFADNDLNSIPTDYQMLVHPFGATSSPSIAGYALRKVARDNSERACPETIKTVKNNFYVDDCLKSLSSPELAVCLIAQLRSLLSSGGFHLSKFTSNCRLILFSIPETDKSVCNAVDIINDLPVSKTLGLVWNTSSNTLKIEVNVKEKPCTRRGLLSIISQVYDPLGLEQPFVLPMKRHLQMLNLESLSWEDLLPESLQVDWNTWLSQLPCLQELAVPRCFKPTGFVPDQMELHCISDGSQAGYGAVAYLRMVFPSGQIYCSFIMGKSRVAPIKPVTIPRMELTDAMVLVCLAHFIHKK